MSKLAEYSFGGSGSTITDDTGNGHNFTLDANTVRAGGGGLTRTTVGQTVGPTVFGQTALRSLSGRLIRSSTSLDSWFPGWELSGTGQWGLIDLGGQRQLRARNSGGAGFAQVAATTGEVAFAGTYDGTNLRLYIGGTLVATTAFTSPLLATATVLYIFDGTGSETTLKDLRIYDHVLSLAEVQADRDTPAGGGASMTLSAATGTGAAQAMTFSKPLTLGAATGAGTAQALAPSKALTLGAATGSGVAAAIALAKGLTLGQAAGTGAVQALAPGKALGLQTATGSGAAQDATLTPSGLTQMNLDTAQGTGAPQPISFTKGLVFGAATGVGAPQALSNGKGLQLGVATGTGSPRAFTNGKSLTLGTAAGLGTAAVMALSRPGVEYDAPTRWTVNTPTEPVVTGRTPKHTARTRRQPYTATTRQNPGSNA